MIKNNKVYEKNFNKQVCIDDCFIEPSFTFSTTFFLTNKNQCHVQKLSEPILLKQFFRFCFGIKYLLY